MSNAIRFFQLLLTCLTLAALAAMNLPTSVIAQEPANGLIMLIEFERIEGLRHWEEELDQRGLTALVQAQRDVIEKISGGFRAACPQGLSGHWYRRGEAILGYPL